MSLISSDDEVLEKATQDLRQDCGAIDFFGEKLPFDATDYYTEEMGANLFRRFVTFERLIPRSALPEIKLRTNRLEVTFEDDSGHRRINIDPGYLCLEHVLLATTKGYSHRPYLRDGIYVDLTLIFRNQSFQPLEWTYPDYRQERVIGLFNRFRKHYLDDLRGRKGQP